MKTKKLLEKANEPLKREGQGENLSSYTLLDSEQSNLNKEKLIKKLKEVTKKRGVIPLSDLDTSE